ncbi:MAG TPA: DUF456 domain-containing protein [Bacillota bacterium]|nr:DUF456 domain-containing protein [Bacillota bacterium]
MLLGIAGTVLPVLPGMPLVLLGIVIYGAVHGFAAVGTDLVFLAIVLTLISLILDYLAVILGAGRARASRQGMLGGLVGGVVGVVVLGWPGLLLGPPIGAVLGEVSSGRTLNQGLRVALATVVGMAATAVLKLVMAGVLTVMFVLRVT